MAHQAGGTVAGQHRVQQIAHRIPAQPAAALVECGAKARQRAERSAVHTRDDPHSGALSPSIPPFVQTQ
ncbi:MAG: hypothetical protein ACRDJW_00065, partial [Thermomicrobiales bacterium]